MSEEKTQQLQIARLIYLKTLAIMKFTLTLEEQSYKEKGRNDPKYRFFKKMLMQTTYDTLREVFAELEKYGFIQKVGYPEDLKHGYKDSLSGGSGYVNTSDLDYWLEDGEVDGNK